MSISKSSNKKLLSERQKKTLGDVRSSKANKEKSRTPVTVQFLLTEYNGLIELWKHTDVRIDSAINYYLAICAFLFPGLGLLSQAIQSFQLFLLVSVAVATATFVFGVLLVQRITSSQFIKSEYRLGLEIIRRYFVDNDPEIAQYLYMTTGPTLENPDEVKRQRSAYFHKNLVRAVNAFNSLLAGGIFGCTIWLGFSNFLTIVSLVLIVFGFSILTFFVLNWLFGRRIKRLVA